MLSECLKKKTYNISLFLLSELKSFLNFISLIDLQHVSVFGSVVCIWLWFLHLQHFYKVVCFLKLQSVDLSGQPYKNVFAHATSM